MCFTLCVRFFCRFEAPRVKLLILAKSSTCIRQFRSRLALLTGTYMVDGFQQGLAARLDSRYMGDLLAVNLRIFQKIRHPKDPMLKKIRISGQIHHLP